MSVKGDSQHTVSSAIEAVPMLESLPEQELNSLKARLKMSTFRNGAHMIREKDAAQSLMFLIQGKARVSLTGNDGKEVVLAHLHAGDFFGEIALLTGQKRSADVTAMESCSLLTLSQEDFEAHAREHSGLVYSLLKDLAFRLKDASSKIGDLALLDVYRRVASTLFDLSEEELGVDQRKIQKRPTHNELAAMVGTSREMVTRALKNLEADGHITVEGKTITLHSRPV